MSTELTHEIYSQVLDIGSIRPVVDPVDVEKAEEIMRHIDFSTPFMSVGSWSYWPDN